MTSVKAKTVESYNMTKNVVSFLYNLDRVNNKMFMNKTLVMTN